MALFLFDIVVLNVFVISLLSCSVCYAFSKERLFLYEAILVACFLIDHFIIFAAQFLYNSFPIENTDLTFISAPGVKILILVARQIAYLLVAKELFELDYPVWTYGIFPLLFLLYWNIQAHNNAPETILFVAAFYTVMQVYLLALVAVCYIKTRSEDNARLKRLLLMTVIFVILIVACDSTWVFGFYNPFEAFFGKAYESNLVETLLHVTYSCFIIQAAISWIDAQIKSHGQKPSALDTADVDKVIQDLGLTKREAEVFRLLVEDCSYQEICDTLVISMSTVKSHAHNIYDKAGLSRRSELRRLVSRGDAS